MSKMTSWIDYHIALRMLNMDMELLQNLIFKNEIHSKVYGGKRRFLVDEKFVELCAKKFIKEGWKEEKTQCTNDVPTNEKQCTTNVPQNDIDVPQCTTNIPKTVRYFGQEFSIYHQKRTYRGKPYYRYIAKKEIKYNGMKRTITITIGKEVSEEIALQKIEKYLSNKGDLREAMAI